MPRGLAVLTALAVLVAGQCAGQCACDEFARFSPQHVTQDTSQTGCHHHGQPSKGDQSKGDQSKPCVHHSSAADRIAKATERGIPAPAVLISIQLDAHQFGARPNLVVAYPEGSPPLDNRCLSTTVLRI